MTNTTHMLISLWGLSLFLSSIESSWLCIIVITFVQMCANSMLNICSLFQELKISWLYLHERKKNAFTNHSYHMCSLEFVVHATMPDLFFSIPAYFNDVIFYFSLEFLYHFEMECVGLFNIRSIEMIDTIGSELCIASPHMLKIIFQVNWLEIHWNSNHILNQLHTYCILYHRRVTLKSVVRYIFYLYIPRWISLLFFFRLLFSTMFRSFCSFFLVFIAQSSLP